jgi:hypothetical protein
MRWLLVSVLFFAVIAGIIYYMLYEKDSAAVTDGIFVKIMDECRRSC